MSVLPLDVIILEAIRRRGTGNFTGREIASETGVCRQTVYAHIRKLNERGHRIEGDRALGFMARLNEEERA